MTDKYACFTGLLDTGIGITENDKELTGDEVARRLNELTEEKELIQEKLLTMILDYNKISNDNWNMGLSEAVESLHDEVKMLFETPKEFIITHDCDECKYYRGLEYPKGNCLKQDKEVDGLDEACDKFEWK